MTTELTDGEKAFFESGGTDVAGVLAENPVPAKVDPVIEHKIEPDKPAAAAEVVAKVDTPAAEAPEPGEEEIPAADGKTKRRMVDSRALKSERERARGLEAELKTERETRARVDERLKMLSEAVTSAEPGPAAATVEVEPDPEADIFGAFKALKDEVKNLRQGFTTAQTETLEQRQTVAVKNLYRQDAANFAIKQPDFMDGYNYLFGARKSQLELQGYAPEEVAGWLEKEEMDLVNRALQNKKSPAEQAYLIAKSMGYAPKAAAAAPAGSPLAAPVAAAAPAAAASPKAPSVTEEIDRIKAGKAAFVSLSNGGGGAGEEMSLEWLANAPLKEFEAFMNKPGNREKVEHAMGRKAA